MPVTDGQITSASVGAVAVSESNPDSSSSAWASRHPRQHHARRRRLQVSTRCRQDLGACRLQATSHAISKIRIHPTNPDIVFVAAFGKYSVPSAERGVFKSTDGGHHLEAVLFRDDKTGAVDIAIDRNNPNVMYAACGRRIARNIRCRAAARAAGCSRAPTAARPGPRSRATEACPRARGPHRCGGHGGQSEPRVCARRERERRLFKSDDAGATWTLMNDNRSNIRQRAFYYTHLFADHKNADVVYMQNTSLFRSADGGKTLTSVGNGTHGDFHDLWIDPDDPAHLVVANDGGGAVTTNTGRNWSAQDFPTAQFYHVITTKHIPFHVCGSQQDNSTLCVPFNWNAGGFRFGRAAWPGGGGPGSRGAYDDPT
jgi:hypothetical protein